MEITLCCLLFFSSLPYFLHSFPLTDNSEFISVKVNYKKWDRFLCVQFGMVKIMSKYVLDFKITFKYISFPFTYESAVCFLGCMELRMALCSHPMLLGPITCFSEIKWGKGGEMGWNDVTSGVCDCHYECVPVRPCVSVFLPHIRETFKLFCLLGLKK